jgi:hypothetical protein
MLDQFYEVTLWSGDSLSQSSNPSNNTFSPESLTLISNADNLRRALIQRLEQTTRYRFPRPNFFLISEKDYKFNTLDRSLSFRSAYSFLDRLIPSHQDGEQWHALTFPQFNQLPLQSKQYLISKISDYWLSKSNDLSFVQYFYNLFNNTK